MSTMGSKRYRFFRGNVAANKRFVFLIDTKISDDSTYNNIVVEDGAIAVYGIPLYHTPGVLISDQHVFLRSNYFTLIDEDDEVETLTARNIVDII